MKLKLSSLKTEYATLKTALDYYDAPKKKIQKEFKVFLEGQADTIAIQRKYFPVLSS